jgi:hypothetical protein
MKEPITIEKELAELKQRCKLLSESLPKAVDAKSISNTAKIPWKAIAYRETLIWRIEELARTAYELFTHDELVSAVSLTRACIETVAAMWYLKQEIQKAIDTKDVTDTDNILMRLNFGSKSDITTYDAINVLTFVEKIDKEINGFKRNYLSLCEFAHPNWSGTSLLYSDPNLKNGNINYGKNVRAKESVKFQGLLSINTALLIFGYSYNEFNDLFPEFISICEENLISKKEKK